MATEDGKIVGNYGGNTNGGTTTTGGTVNTIISGNVYLTPTSYVSASDAYAYYAGLAFDPSQRYVYNQLNSLLKAKGMQTGPAGIISATTAAIEYAAMNNSSLDIYSLIASMPNQGDGSSGGPSTVKQTVSNISTRSDAQKTLNDSFKAELGREANAAEIRAFQKALNAMEKGSPSTTTQTTSTSGDNTSISTQTTGGFNAAQFAEDWAKSQPEYAENFAATTFMNVLSNTLNQTPNVVRNV